MTDIQNPSVQLLPQWGHTGHAPIMSESIPDLSTALATAQGEFEAVAKSAANPFFKSSYAPLPEVVKAATPILAKHGLAIWQGVDHDGQGDLLWTMILHKSGQYLGSAMRLRPVKNDPQAQGSALTYGRRYSYMAALGLVADEDDDGETASGRGKAQSKPKPRKAAPVTRQEPSSDQSDDDSTIASDDTLVAIREAYKASGVDTKRMAEIITEAGAEGKRVSELTQDQANGVLLKLRHIAQDAA